MADCENLILTMAGYFLNGAWRRSLVRGVTQRKQCGYVHNSQEKNTQEDTHKIFASNANFSIIFLV